MLKRKWLLTTVICSGLLLAGGMVNKTMAAQTGGVFQPDSDWVVSKLAATQADGNPYCALARRFDSNLILTLARNTRDESSIAIDFQKSALNRNNNYTVTLKPGFGQDRAFNVRPVSGKALVIRLGEDYAFYDSLNRSEQLEIDVSGQSYSFNLSDFSKGQKKLTTCLVNLVEPAAGSSASVMTPLPKDTSPAAKPARKAYMTDVSHETLPSSSSSALENMREENMRLRNALERERRTYEDRYMREANNSSMAAEVNEKLRILETENVKLKTSLLSRAVPVPQKPLSCPKQDNKISEAVESELSMLRDRNLSLKKDIAAEKTKQILLEKELAEKGKPEDVGMAVMTRLRADVERLEKENRDLKIELATSVSGTKDATPVSLSQVKSLEEQLHYVQQDRDKLLNQIEGLTQGKEDSRFNISSKNWNLEQASRRFNEAEREIRRLGRQLEEKQAQCATEKKKLEYMLFDPGVAKKEQISKLMNLEKKNLEFSNIIKTFETEKGAYEQKLASLKEKISTQDVAAIGFAEAEDHIAQLETEIQESRLAAEKGDKLALDVESIRQERDMLKNEKSRLTLKVASLESTLAGIQTSAGGPASLPSAVVSEPVSLKNTVSSASGRYEDVPPQYQDKSFQGGYQDTHQGGFSVPLRKNLMTISTLASVLDQAQISIQGDITQVDGSAVNSDFVAYSWDTGSLFGSAEQQAMGDASRFDDLAHRYLDQTKSRCQGDFAAVPVMAEQNGSLRVSSYEIACINDEGGASASVVFYNDGDLFTTIAHETELESMENAMDVRDRLVASLMQMKVASR